MEVLEDLPIIRLPQGKILYLFERINDSRPQKWFFLHEDPMLDIVKWKITCNELNIETYDTFRINIWQVNSPVTLIWLHEGYTEYDLAVRLQEAGGARNIGTLDNFPLARSMCLHNYDGWVSHKLLSSRCLRPSEIMICNDALAKLSLKESIDVFRFMFPDTDTDTAPPREEIEKFLKWFVEK
jgi:hypothetical protein